MVDDDTTTTGRQIVELTPVETHPLRRAVLRVGTPTTDVTFPEDALPGTFHIGVADAGVLVATSTWISRAFAGAPDRAAIQLRGMATAHHLQGTGVGGLLLGAGIDRARAAGATLVWANARDTALGFYARHGFAVDGDGFVDRTTALAHHVVVRQL